MTLIILQTEKHSFLGREKKGAERGQEEQLRLLSLSFLNRQTKTGVRVCGGGRKRLRRSLPQLAQSAGSSLCIWVSTLHHQHFSQPAQANGEGADLHDELHY